MLGGGGEEAEVVGSLARDSVGRGRGGGRGEWGH